VLKLQVVVELLVVLFVVEQLVAVVERLVFFQNRYFEVLGLYMDQLIVEVLDLYMDQLWHFLFVVEQVVVEVERQMDFLILVVFVDLIVVLMVEYVIIEKMKRLHQLQ